MPKFVHLHNHTDFSLQDAAQSIDMMLDRVEELGMKSIAVTEHGNLFSMVPFYEKAKKDSRYRSFVLEELKRLESYSKIK